MNVVTIVPRSQDPFYYHSSNSSQGYRGFHFLSLCCMKPCILFKAISSVFSLMFAKQTLNHPGSEQWQEDPGEIFSFTSHSIEFQRANSPSLVCSSNNGLRFIQQNSPAFPFKHSIPALFSPWMIISYLSFSLSLFMLVYFSVNSLSASIEAKRCCVWEEIRVKLDILLAVVTTLSLYEYIVPTLKPGRPRSLERL